MPVQPPQGEEPGTALRYLVIAAVAAFVLMAIALAVAVATGGRAT